MFFFKNKASHSHLLVCCSLEFIRLHLTFICIKYYDINDKFNEINYAN